MMPKLNMYLGFGLLLTIIYNGQPILGQPNPEPSSVTGEIEGEEYAFNGKIYLIGEDRMDYFDALSHCIRYGGKLASLPNDGNVTLDFFRRVGGFYDIHSHYWLDIMANGVQPVLNASIHDPILFTNCTAYPEDCRLYSPGPFPEYAEMGSGGGSGGGGGVLSGTCVAKENCAFDFFVDILGNNVTFLPFLSYKSGSHSPGKSTHQCVNLAVDYCEQELSCLVAGLHTDHCDRRENFICEKEACGPMDIPVFDDMPDIEIWEEVFGLENYCGSRYMQLVVNECSVQFLDIRNIRLGNGPENCTTEFPNLVEAELGFNSTCGVESHIDLEAGYLSYYYTVFAELGPGKRPASDDFIRRDRPIAFEFSCVYDLFYYADLYHPIIPLSSTRKIFTGTGRNRFVFNMDFYQTSSFMNLLTPPIVVFVPDYVHVGITTDMNVPLGILINECWASYSSVFERPSNGNFYDLIIDGCPVGTDVTNQTFPEPSKSYFSFRSFEFKDSTTDQIYVHCRFEICNSPHQVECHLPVCADTPVRNRRNIENEKLHSSTLGPIQIYNKNRQRKVSQNSEIGLCEKDNGGCSHFCVVFSSTSTCVCPDNMHLSADEKTCYDSGIEIQESYSFASISVLVCSITSMLFAFLFVAFALKKCLKQSFKLKIIDT